MTSRQNAPYNFFCLLCRAKDATTIYFSSPELSSQIYAEQQTKKLYFSAQWNSELIFWFPGRNKCNAPQSTGFSIHHDAPFSVYFCESSSQGRPILHFFLCLLTTARQLNLALKQNNKKRLNGFTNNARVKKILLWIKTNINSSET